MSMRLLALTLMAKPALAPFGLAASLIVSLTAPLAGQLPAGHIVVATHTTGGAAATTLLDVDPQTGTFTALPRFPFDHWAPFAVAVDPVAGDVLVALDDPANVQSLILRLRFAGGALILSRGEGSFVADTADMAHGPEGDLFAAFQDPAATIGGIVQVYRNGRGHVRVHTGFAHSAMEVAAFATQALIVEAGQGGPELSFLDLVTGQINPLATIGALAGRRVTGVHDLPTGAFRQALSDDLGRLHVFETGQLRTIQLNPALPAGGANAMRGQGLDAIVLGGAAHPVLIRAPVFGAGVGTWTAIAGPLPGDPVDFALVPLSSARFVRFGSGCGNGGTLTTTGLPSLNGMFQLGVIGAPVGAPAFLVLGLDDQQFGPVQLPFALPGGCLLYVSVDAPLPTTIDALGQAQQTLSVPGDPALVGARLFAQWLVGSLASFGTTSAVAIWIGL